MDSAGLAVLRMLFGVIIILEGFRYLDLGRLVAKFIPGEITFKFVFFEWIPTLSPLEMRYVFIAYLIAGILIVLGLFYRLAATLAFACISYIFLVDASNYLNHFYLFIIFSGMMIFMPANKTWSLDAWLWPTRAQSTVPAWTYQSIRWQFVIVYFYAAVAKMNVDWINGMPLFDWIGSRAELGGFNVIFAYPITIYLFAYGGLFYDLLIAPMLMWKKTRFIAVLLSLFFHLSNYILFNIGMFPWFMLAATTIFFEPEWPRRLLHWASHQRLFKALPAQYAYVPYRLSFWQKFGFIMLGLHLTFQATFPLRHFLYPSYSAWSEEGHNFSWHMKLRGKHGSIRFTVKDPDTGKTKVVDHKKYLTERQLFKMRSRPDQIIQFAHFLRDYYTLRGEKPMEVYADTKIALNGRKHQRLLDPTVNLSEIEQTIKHRPYLFPLRQPVWNAENKKNRFGVSLKKDEIAYRAIPGLKAPEEQIASSK